MSYLKYKNKINGLGIRIVETGDVFETRAQCAEFLGVTPGMITMCLNGSTKGCRGYHLDVIETDFSHPLTPDIIEELNDICGEQSVWAEHPWRDNIYVSDTGIIAKNVHGRIIVMPQHILNSGYLTVSVDDYKTRRNANGNQLVHRLVAETYIPNPDGKPHVNHIDANKLNNSVDNLEWCTLSENMIHAYKHGLCSTEEVMIEETGEVFSSCAECARAICGTSSGIHDCKTGRQQKHRGYHFKFPKDGKFDADDRMRFLGVVVTDIRTGEEAYFSTIKEACDMLSLSRKSIVRALNSESNVVADYIFEYADREDRLLYGDEDNKQLSWL